MGKKFRGGVCVAVLFCFLGVVLGVSFGAPSELILATTTSTQDSGLLDTLIPVFEKKTGYFVKTIAVGSGQAMALGARGEADVLLVHSPEEEDLFMQQGLGSRRRPVMYNDFVLVGPAEDPAGIRKEVSAAGALARIASGAFLFLSRGDRSGTHVREIRLWEEAGLKPQGSRWYQETGQGMGQTLMVASEKGGYTLSDRGTYLALAPKLSLKILLEGDQGLRNEYHVIEVNPSRFKRVNATGATLLADFLVSKEAQEIIRDFGVRRFGQPLFFPMAIQD